MKHDCRHGIKIISFMLLIYYATACAKISEPVGGIRILVEGLGSNIFDLPTGLERLSINEIVTALVRRCIV